MGQTIKSVLSWEGKVADAPTTIASQPVTHEQLVEVEKNILKLLDELNEKIAKAGGNNEK